MLRKVLGNSAKCVVQSVILVINGCCSKCNFAYMKTKIILAALMVVGVLSGKTEKKMNETLNQKQQVLVSRHARQKTTKKRWREFLMTLSKEVC